MLRMSMLRASFLPTIAVERPRRATWKRGMKARSRQGHFLPLHPPKDVSPGSPAETPGPKAMEASRAWFLPSCRLRSPVEPIRTGS